MRPHTGMSFNHSAVNCMTLKKVLQGEMTLQDWESEVLQWAEGSSLFATVVGSYYVHHAWSLSFNLGVVRLIFALLRNRLVNLLSLFRARP